MRRAAMGLAMLLAASAAWAQETTATDRREVEAKLDTVKVTVDFRETALADALAFVSDYAGVNIVLSPQADEACAAARATLTLRLKDLPLRRTLRLMLDQVGLTATYQDGVLLVVPPKSIESKIYMAVYDVRDLLMAVQDFPGPMVELQAPDPIAASDRCVWGIDLTEREEILTPEFLENMVRENTGGTSWKDNPETCVIESNGLLLVVQSRRVHEEIAGLLGKLRQYK